MSHQKLQLKKRDNSILKINNCTGVILSGGEGKRIGFPKQEIELGGFTILNRTVRVLEILFSEIILIKKEEQTVSFPGIKIINDDSQLPPSALRGIYGALKAASNPWIFVCGVDMPFLKAELIAYLFKYNQDFKGIIPCSEDGPHPLHGYYHQSLLASMEYNLRKRKLRILEIFADKDICFVKQAELLAKNFNLLSFFNINTPNDLIQAEKLLAEQGQQLYRSE